MSIASEYAARVVAAKSKPEWYETRGQDNAYACAYVTSEGDFFCSGGPIRASDALALAAWIIKTFGESDDNG